jgi:hypothetical protein
MSHLAGRTTKNQVANGSSSNLDVLQIICYQLNKTGNKKSLELQRRLYLIAAENVNFGIC